MKNNFLKIFIFTLFFTPQLSFAGVGGNGPVCENVKSGMIAFYEFFDSTVSYYEIGRKNDLYYLHKYEPYIYSTTFDEITWKERTFSKTLDRKTLVLRTFFYGELSFTDRCQVYSTEELYRQVDKILNLYQKKYDAGRKENKI